MWQVPRVSVDPGRLVRKFAGGKEQASNATENLMHTGRAQSSGRSCDVTEQDSACWGGPVFWINNIHLWDQEICMSNSMGQGKHGVDKVNGTGTVRHNML